MNLKEAKDQIAREYGHTSFDVAIIMQPSIAVKMTNELATLYASEKVKEALQVAAEREEVIYHDGTTKQETHHKQVNVGNNHVRPNRGMILSLETELVNNIKNDK